MEKEINKVELRGRIGSVRVDDGIGVAAFTLATNRVYRDSDHNPVIETTWHAVKVWKGTVDFAFLEKGRIAHLEGFLCNRRFTDLNGYETTSVEVRATKCEIEDE